MPPTTPARIPAARVVRGRLNVPGDKSISHRYAILAALASGRTRIVGYAPGADCRSTLACLGRLGVETEPGPEHAVTVLGRKPEGLRSSRDPLDAGNSGTTMRLLAGVAAGRPFTTQLTGDASLSRRPMRRIIEPLARMGARLEAVDGHAPLTVRGAPLHGIRFAPDVPSAQVKSAVLLAGLQAVGTTVVEEPCPTRDHTERALVAFGARLERRPGAIVLEGAQALGARTVRVPGDFSSAAFFLVAAAALPGSRVEIEDVGLNPTRTALLGVLRRFGAHVQVIGTGEEAGELRGTVVVEGDQTNEIDIAPDEVPLLIDELPAIAALAAHGGEVRVSGAAELRVKESDRIATLVAGFRSLGIDADERADGFVVHGAAGGNVPGGAADARGDHRMAMAFAIAALGGRRASFVEGADSVAISYPGFFDTLERLVA
jgi:3-phosphoshikimate 1-carboxyvinyltransferase